MAILTPAYMEQVSKGFKKVFQNALKENKLDYTVFATEVQANTMTVDYSWIANMPSMREWVGDRILKDLAVSNYTIKKKNWESSIQVDRDVLQYDSLGIVKPQLLSLAEVVYLHYMRILTKLMENNGVCYDGQNYFSKTHSVGGVDFSNLGSDELNEDSFMKTREEMATIVSDEAEPLDVDGCLLMVPPSLESTAIKLVQTKTLASGADNPCYNLAKLLVNRRLTDKKSWYLFDNSKVLKPAILQINKKVDFTALDKPESTSNFMRRKFIYGIDTEDNAGYALWQLAYKHKVA